MSDILTPSPMGEEPNESNVKEVNPLGNGRAGKWFENFWYHYKFQALAAIFLVIVLIICSTQCIGRCSREDTIKLCYAGTYNLGIAKTENNTPTQQAMISTLAPTVSRITEEDAETAAGMLRIWNYLIDPDSEFSAVVEQSRQNRENLKNELNTGDVYLFLLAEDLYRTYAFTPEDKTPYMMKMDAYLPASGVGGLRLTDDGYGVYLSSTPLGAQPGFDQLPEDTILCLRTSFSLFNRRSKNQERLYAKNEELLRTILDSSQW